MKKFAGMVFVAILVVVFAAAFSVSAAGTFTKVNISDDTNNDGISTDKNPGDQAFDGAGWGYPAEELSSKDFTVTGPAGKVIPFAGLLMEDGDTNNIEAQGQTVDLPEGKYAAVYFLVSSHHGATENGVVIFTYSDGSTSEGYINAGDWCGNPIKDELEVIKVTHRHDKNGDTGPAARIWLEPAIALNADKTLVSVTLPDNNKLHVFGITLEK